MAERTGLDLIAVRGYVRLNRTSPGRFWPRSIGDTPDATENWRRLGSADRLAQTSFLPGNSAAQRYPLPFTNNSRVEEHDCAEYKSQRKSQRSVDTQAWVAN
jgi:hypothetical protein